MKHTQETHNLKNKPNKQQLLQSKHQPVLSKPSNSSSLKQDSPTLPNKETHAHSNRGKDHIKPNISKVNSIVVLSRAGQEKPHHRPLSDENKHKKVQPKSVQKPEIVPRKAPSKSIAHTNKKGDTEEQRLSNPISQSKDWGLVYTNPQFDQFELQPLEITDPVYEKYFDMISNDNDTIFVLNALPELKTYKNDIEENKLDFVLSNRMSRISGQFNQLTPEKTITILKNKPVYFETKSKVGNHKLQLETKFKVRVDVGFLQCIVEADRVVITRFYLSRIYRRMNYLASAYCFVMKYLLERYGGLDKVSIFMHDRNLASIKFLKALGGKIERILTQSSNQKLDYFQEFTLRKKQVLSSCEGLGI